MRVGLVCPYDLDVPGGVQAHVLGLARALRAGGDDVEVLAPMSGRDAGSLGVAGLLTDPVDGATAVPSWVHRAGGSVALPYNGALARVGFGPGTARRVRAWVARGRFDLLHVHEPVTPSASLLALWAAQTAGVPVVVTFHAASARSRALTAVRPLVAPSLLAAFAHLAVSTQARDRVAAHLRLATRVVPNGLDVARFASARGRDAWRGRPGAPTLAVLGRLEEPRKGFSVVAAALPRLRAAVPGLRVLAAGTGRAEAARALAGPHADAVEVLGVLSEHDKAALLASVDAYLAPQVGGESFGVVLAEAMGAGAPVVASALPAFADLLEGGRLGALVAVADAGALADAVLDVVADPGRAASRAHRAARAVWRYDWSQVAGEVRQVYADVLLAGDAGERAWGRVGA